ncbi:MAG: hypothetical protein K2Q10_08850 [Rhodospirillales bacterium]|nr:hypothetical protein [Rhodospirillales bacterium]
MDRVGDVPDFDILAVAATSEVLHLAGWQSSYEREDKRSEAKNHVTWRQAQDKTFRHGGPPAPGEASAPSAPSRRTDGMGTTIARGGWAAIAFLRGIPKEKWQALGWAVLAGLRHIGRFLHDNRDIIATIIKTNLAITLEAFRLFCKVLGLLAEWLLRSRK